MVVMKREHRVFVGKADVILQTNSSLDIIFPIVDSRQNSFGGVGSRVGMTIAKQYFKKI